MGQPVKGYILFISIILHYSVSYTSGVCSNLPDVWTQGKWFSRYDNGYSWVAEYSAEAYVLKIPNIQTVVNAAYTCQHNEQQTETTQTLLVNHDQNYCMKVSTPPNALSLLVQFGPAPPNAETASDCNTNPRDPQISWQVRYPLDLNYAPCPFGSDGTKYHAKVWDGTSWNCENDRASSVEVVGGDRYTVDTCIHKNVYQYPLKGATLYCKGHMSGSELGHQDNYVLLGFDNGREIHFYCGRYAREGDTVFMSFTTKYFNKPTCEPSATAKTADSNHIAFKLSRWARTIGGPDRSTTAALGLCSFPPRWRPMSWFIGYRTKLGGADAHLYRFDDGSVRQVSSLNPWAADWISTCREADYQPPHYFYLVNGIECMEFTEINPELLLYKHVVLGAQYPKVEYCKDQLLKSSFTTILVKHQNYTTDRIAEGESDCPLPVGIYQTTFVGGDLQTQCENNNGSTTRVGSSDLRIRTCVKSNKYESPYYVDLTCVTSWKQSAVRTERQGAGDYLLLSYYDTDHTRTHYYVARYKQEGDEIYLSLHTIGNGQQINFNANANPYSSGPDYTAFTLKRSTEALQCGCRYGDCVVEKGSKRCECYHGYVGVNCDTSLPSGTCQSDNTCKNSAECVDVPTNIGRHYFYCRCPEGYRGLHCELTHPCYPNPCNNGGDCTPRGSGFQCSCRPNYDGFTCEITLASIDHSNDQGSTLLIVLVTAIGGVLVLAVILAIILRQRRLKRKQEEIPVNPDSDMPKQNPKMQAWYADYKETYKSQMAASEEKTFDDY